MIFDTSFLIDLMNNADAAVEKAIEIEASTVPQRVPLLVIYELFTGVGKGSMPDQERQKIQRVLSPRQIEGADEALARQAGLLDGELQAGHNGRAIGAVDALVAATGLRFDEPVVTRDPDDFDGIDGLDVEVY